METQAIKVLLGFKLKNDRDDRETEKKMINQMKALGYEPTLFSRNSKKEVQAFLEQNRDCNYVALMETIGQSSWTQNELADLMDERNLNLVIVLTAARAKQLEYLTTIYAAGITSAIFEPGSGVPAEEVAELLIKQRSRKAAREYYRIDTKNISIRSLTNEMYNGLVVKLMDPEYGKSIMGRLLGIAGTINPYQMGDFIKKLPDNLVEELSQYAEYGQLIAQLKECGIKVAYKRPKQYKSMNDDVPFIEGAKEELAERGMDTTYFEPKPEEPQKKTGLLGLFGLKGKKKEEHLQNENTDSEYAQHQQPVTENELIEGLGEYSEWDDSWNQQEMEGESYPSDLTEDGSIPDIEEENELDLTGIEHNSQPQSTKVKATETNIDADEADGDDSEFFF